MAKQLDRNEWQNNVMSICESKAGKLYIKVNPKLKGDLVIKPGEALQLEAYQDVLDKLLEKEIIDQDEYDRRSEAEEFIKYKITLPPLD